MILTKEELVSMLKQEVRLLLHLVSKVDPAVLDYRPTAGHRSMLELLQYLTNMGPIHLRLIKSGVFEMDAWSKEWTTANAAAAAMNMEQVTEAMGKLADEYEQAIMSCTDEELREVLPLFGGNSTRGAWMVNLLLTHHAAYRMQVFQYLKTSGKEELNTLNLWVGVDGPMK